MSELTDLTKENETLKCQVVKLKTMLVDISHALLEGTNLEQFKGIYDWGCLSDEVIDETPNYCLNSVRTDAVRDLANTCCPVSGYIITSEESRKQMIQWVEFEEATNG